MSAVSVRVFAPEDQDVVHGLYKSCMFQYEHLGLPGLCYSSFVKEKTSPGGDMCEVYDVYLKNADGKKRCFWVAELDGKVVGFLGAIPSTKYTEDYVELVRMFVAPESREHGIGRKLVSALEEWSREAGYRNVYLSTISVLDAPNKFYPKCGFVLREYQDFDVCEMVGLPSPAIVGGNHYVKPLVVDEKLKCVTVRQFEPKDQDAVRELFLAGENNYIHLGLVGQRYAWNVRDKTSPTGDLSHVQAAFMDPPANGGSGKGCFFVAELDGQIVGIVGAKHNPKYGADCVELVRMAVSPEIRKLGVGRKLVAALVQWAEEVGYKHVKLFTLADLPNPNQLYPKCGFVLTGYEDLDVTQILNLDTPTIIKTAHYSKVIGK